MKVCLLKNQALLKRNSDSKVIYYTSLKPPIKTRINYIFHTHIALW